MSIYNKFILSLVLSTCLINVLLAMSEKNDPCVYLTANVIVYLAVTSIFVYFNPRVKKALKIISFTLFGSFMVIVAFKVIQIISGGE